MTPKEEFKDLKELKLKHKIKNREIEILELKHNLADYLGTKTPDISRDHIELLKGISKEEAIIIKRCEDMLKDFIDEEIEDETVPLFYEGIGMN